MDTSEKRDNAQGGVSCPIANVIPNNLKKYEALPVVEPRQSEYFSWIGTCFFCIVNLTRVWQTGVMKTKTPSYQRHRFPAEIISHAVWLYHRFCLSFREVEELLAERGITVTYETVRQWC